MRSIPHPKSNQLFPQHFLLFFFPTALPLIIYLDKQIYNSSLILNETISRQISQFDKDSGIDI